MILQQPPNKYAAKHTGEDNSCGWFCLLLSLNQKVFNWPQFKVGPNRQYWNLIWYDNQNFNFF